MTRDSILEYAEAIRGRYPSVSRKEKGTFLGYIEVTFRYFVAFSLFLVEFLGRSRRVPLAHRRTWAYNWRDQKDLVVTLEQLW